MICSKTQLTKRIDVIYNVFYHFALIDYDIALQREKIQLKQIEIKE